jgi:hypothetical protein
MKRQFSKAAYRFLISRDQTAKTTLKCQTYCYISIQAQEFSAKKFKSAYGDVRFSDTFTVSPCCMSRKVKHRKMKNLDPRQSQTIKATVIKLDRIDDVDHINKRSKFH